MLAIARQGHIYRCAPTMNTAPTTTLVAVPNIPTALALATLPPPAPAIAIFVKRGHTRLINATDPARIAEKYECTGPRPAQIGPGQCLHDPGGQDPVGWLTVIAGSGGQPPRCGASKSECAAHSSCCHVTVNDNNRSPNTGGDCPAATSGDR
uniref:Uncharacterized protein n=1 Tax=Romanomermis culicivorax TaxID=13658 RepID=A0A915IUM4_ROMCU